MASRTPFNPASPGRSSLLAPVTIVSTKAQSSTDRANTPVVSSVWDIGATPSPGQRPGVGLKPTTPHNDAGTLIDPTVSPPRAAGTSRAATEAPAPLDEPPVTRLMP